MLYYRQEGDIMQILIRGSKVEITDAMRDYVEEKLKKLDKYLENSDNVKANVLVKIEGHKQTVEKTLLSVQKKHKMIFMLQ